MGSYAMYEDGRWQPVIILQRVHFRRRSFLSSSHGVNLPDYGSVISHDTGRPSYHSYGSSSYLTNGSPSLGYSSRSLDSGSRAYQTGSGAMSRYTSRSLDVGSTRYDSSSSYKSLEPSSLGSYRSSNLSGYSSHGYSSRADGRSAYSSGSSSSSTLGSGRLSGSYSSRSTTSDSLPLPRSSSFGRTEVLSSSTPRDQADKGSYSSSLGRSSSSVDEVRSSRYSSRTSTLTSSQSFDTRSDAAAERRLRLAERRRQREEVTLSETSSDNSKEPSVERASSLRRDSDSDNIGTLGSSLSRRLSARRLQESAVTEESEGKESSPEVTESSWRRSRRLRDAKGNTAKETLPATSSTTDCTSRRHRRQQEETSAQSHDTEDSLLQSSEARRARRQKRLEAAGRQSTGSQDEEGDHSQQTTSRSSTTRPWRQHLQEQDISDMSRSDTHAEQSQSRRREQDEDRRLLSTEGDDTRLESRRHSRETDSAESSRRRSLQTGSEEVDGEPRTSDGVSTEVESRAERIARYKEERRKQLAHIASITSTSGAEVKETEVLPSLFISSKKDKEESKCDGNEQTVSRPESSENGSTLMSRLRALRRGSEESDSPVFTAQIESSDYSTEQKGKSSSAVSKNSDTSSLTGTILDRGSTDPVFSSAPSLQPSQTSASGKTPLESSRERKSQSPVSGVKPLTSTGTTSTSTKSPLDSREQSPKKPSSINVEVGSNRRSSQSSSEARKSKSPSPVSSRLMEATVSSAAKGVHSSSGNRASPPSRSSPSPGGNTASDKHDAVRSTVGSSSSKGPPKIKQTLMPEHRPKGLTSTGSFQSIKSSESGIDEEETSLSKRSGSTYLVRIPLSQQTESQKVNKDPSRRPTADGTSVPRRSSSSFSAVSSTFSSDSGVGSSQLSSLSSARSPEKETLSTSATQGIKAPRLQRTARVEVSSSSSREGSEEKQIPSVRKQTTKGHSSVKRTSSLPSKAVLREGTQAKVSDVSPIAESPKLLGRRRTFSSSSPEKEPSPPKDISVSLKAVREEDKSKVSAESAWRQRKARTASDESRAPSFISPQVSAASHPLSPTGAVALDDILAKNAEFLSSDEEDDKQARTEQRKLRAGEEPKLRRSLRRKALHKSGSNSRDDVGSSVRESTDTRQAEGMEGQDIDVKITTSSRDVTQGSGADTGPSSQATLPTAALLPGGKGDEDSGRGEKEPTPDSDSVFHTASSAPSSTEMPRRRRPDKSELRKSDLNKASAEEGTSHGSRDERGGRGEQEVSDMRNLFSGLSQEKSSPSADVTRSSHITRHPSRGKEFSQLLSKFSSSSEGSSNERSDSEGTGRRRRGTSFRSFGTRGGSSSSDDASLRNTPERTQSLRIVRPTVKEEEDEEKRVERSGSFKSDFMKKRFSPEPSAELSEVLSRRHKEVERQQQDDSDSDKRGDRRVARAEHFKGSAVEEVIADSEVAQVLNARRKETDENLSVSQYTFSAIDSSLEVLARVTHELQDDKETSPESRRLTLAVGKDPESSSRRKSSESLKEAEQLITDVQSRISSSLHLAESSQLHTTGKTEESLTQSSSTLPHTVHRDTIDTNETAKETVSRDSGDDFLSKRTSLDSAHTHNTKNVSDRDVCVKGEHPSESVSIAGSTQRSERLGSSEREKQEETTSSVIPAVTADLKASTFSAGASGLRRAESMKQESKVARSESFERKGILKRSGSLSRQEARSAVDPQLIRIMEERRRKEMEMAKEKGENEHQAEEGSSRPRALSAAEEIEQNIRHMREVHGKEHAVQQSEEEAALFMSVTDRIFKMQNKIEEERHTPITPKSRSGAATPKIRSWSSGSITPRKQLSVDEGVSEVIPEETTLPDSTEVLAASEEVSSAQLMEKLETLAHQSAQYEERRHRFQKRQREDWRTRTQPVTLEEIQEADSLDSVSSFRAEVRRNASKSVFEQLKTQEHRRPLSNKGSEFPLDLVPEKRGRKSRRLRHKTLPVTAEELNAIPEGGELLEPVSLRETHEPWKRDSRTDSGILSGSDVESLASDSLRSLTLEMDVSDNDPSRLSVYSKTSMFRSMDDRAKQEREKEKSASGAKRYIDRKKRERSRTQPVTDDEVKTAAEMSDEKKPTVKIPQPEVVNRPKSSSINQEPDEEEDDQLTKLSLAEKVKLFSQTQGKKGAGAKPPPRTDAPTPRRRHLNRPSRFNTQPVTPEELEKASKISPLAMSLVKPPDPELLMGLKLKDQQELMMMHAEATLSQCSSRSGSRASSQPGSRRGSFTYPETLSAADQDGVHSTFSEKGSTELSSTTTTVDMTTISSGRKQQSGSHSELSRTESEPRGILKKTKSTESVPSDNTFKPISSSETTSTSDPSRTDDVKDTAKLEQESDRVSPGPDFFLPEVDTGDEVTASPALLLSDDDLNGESTTDPGVEELVSDKSPDSRRRSRAADRKAQGERYLTQPAPRLTPERSPQTKRKYEGRHMTQPITPMEMKEAESSTAPSTMMSGGSIADRLNQLKTSGEENWKRRVTKDKDMNTPVMDVKLREKKGLSAVRPVSISDRLGKLEVSAEQWRERVGDTDAKHFTVANKMSKAVKGSESPLVARIKASSKKDLSKLADDSSNGSSPINSPSTPTKEFLPKVPLPKEIIADPDAVKKAEESKVKEKDEMKEKDKEKEEAVRVEVPKVDEAEIEQFFSTKEITEISDRVDLEIDDFNNIFIEANEILQSVRKIRPARKNKATSRNPLKTVSQFVEIQTEYTQVSTGAAEKHLRRMKTEGLKRDAGFALEALAGLASKENFSKVELRKTEPSSLPASLAMRQNPFSDLMLLHVKGRRNTQTRLVEPSSKSINAGDCYILVTPDKVINWIGEYSNIIEKAKSAEVASFIQQKRDMGCKSAAGVQTVDQSKDHLGAGKHFWAALSGEKECQACGPDEEDELYESSIIKTNMVYRLMDGALHPYEQYWGTIPKHSMLDKKEVLVFDFGSEFYVWQGKAVSASLRKQGMSLAQKLWDKGYDYSECAVNPMGPHRTEEDGGIPWKASQRPDWAIFGKVNQNMETILFREKFADWPDISRLIGIKRTKSNEMKSDFASIEAYDAKKMITVVSSPVTLLLEGAHVGRGKKWAEDMQGFIKEQDILTLGIKVWHVLEYDHFEMPESSYGQFHRGDTYVVRWQYMITNAGLRSLKGQAARHSLTGRERCAYFFWQGQDSTINEKGASALMTVELDEERGPQVRVVQGKEPPCFLNLFEGNMIVHIGKREDASTNTAGPWRLYCLRGDDAGEVCLLEIPTSITNLRSCSSMILLNTRTGIMYVWHGVRSPKHTRQLCVGAAQNLKKQRPLELDLHKDAHIIITEVEEGEEKADIWSALDSKNRSLYNSLLADPACYDYTPRLFFMTSVSMVFEVTEQLNPARLPGTHTPFPFFQSDLYKASQPALFLLDVGSRVYLWQGWWPVGSEEMENVLTGSAAARYNVDRRCAMETTLNYCKERGKEGKVPEAYLVCAGLEPLVFQNLFPFWECDSVVHNLALQEGRHDGYCESVEDVYIKLTQTRYPLEVLQERPLPDGVDPLKLESYLADEEFEEVLEMKREEFYALHTWKQTQLKQALGLF